jgi:2-amino-4-hydroxy-6-hydroxymethyldihydropteridine diphosphokinase
MHCLLNNEQQLGRVRIEKSGPRLIDIDLLFFNAEIVESTDLTIPHPRLHQRRFALEPMNEIAPLHVHPLFQKTIHALLHECTDELAVQKI